MLRLREAEAGEAGELAPPLAAGIVGDTDQGAVAEPNAARVEPAREPLLHDREQLDQRSQPAVVLRLLGQVRKPAGQDPADQAEELPIRADPNRCLGNGQRDQFSVAHQRPAAAPRRDRVLVREHIRCNDKGFWGRDYARRLAASGTRLLTPDKTRTLANERREHALASTRLVIESVFANLKTQMKLEHHLARTPAGLALRIAQRTLALTIGMLLNTISGRPARALAAYDGR